MQIDFVHVGFPKCASTWLESCFLEHPQIALNRKYRLFHRDDYDSPVFQNQDLYNKILGESFEGYVQDIPNSPSVRETLERIRESTPSSKIIIVIRNQIDLIESAYKMYIHSGESYDNLFDFLSSKKGNRVHPPGVAFKKMCYFSAIINSYRNAFPLDNIFIYPYELLQEDNRNFLRLLWSFLDIDRDFVPSVIDEKVNQGKDISGLRIMSKINCIKNKLPEQFRKRLPGRKVLRHIYETTIMSCGKLLDRQDNNQRNRFLDSNEISWVRKQYKEDNQRLQKIIDYDLSSLGYPI